MLKHGKKQLKNSELRVGLSSTKYGTVYYSLVLKKQRNDRFLRFGHALKSVSIRHDISICYQTVHVKVHEQKPVLASHQIAVLIGK